MPPACASYTLGAGVLDSSSGSSAAFMISYDATGWRFFALIFRTHGSALPASLPAALICGAWSVCIAVFHDVEVFRDILQIDASIFSNIFVIVLGFIVSLRITVAWNRYWESAQIMVAMSEHWQDSLEVLEPLWSIASAEPSRGISWLQRC